MVVLKSFLVVKGGKLLWKMRIYEVLVLGYILKFESGAVVHSCNSSTWEVEAGGSGGQGHP